MELTATARKKILRDLVERSIKKNIGNLPKSGRSENEFDYEFYISPLKGNENRVFVISKKLIYQNQKLTDIKYIVYPYDTEGNYVEGIDAKNFNGHFHKTKIKLE